MVMMRSMRSVRVELSDRGPRGEEESVPGDVASSSMSCCSSILESFLSSPALLPGI